MEHAGGSGVLFSVGAAVEAYGGPAAATSHHYSASPGRSQHREIKWESQQRSLDF